MVLPSLSHQQARWLDALLIWNIFFVHTLDRSYVAADALSCRSALPAKDCADIAELCHFAGFIYVGDTTLLQ